jgi:tRNA1Val (adenine37-N6)-methyltransferase
LFRFKQFTIHDDRCAMKVGTDGVLLGAWTDCGKALQVLDIGTGSGLLALMIAQRQPEARVTALEIDETAFLQAFENATASPFAERISIFHTALQQFRPPSPFDLIVCNPPFFKVSSTAPDAQRNLARQAEQLALEDIFGFCRDHLTVSGQLSIIFPVYGETEQIAASFGLFTARRTWVKGMPHLPAKRVLYTFRKKNTETIEEEIVIESSRHEYTEVYKSLLKDFYLAF